MACTKALISSAVTPRSKAMRSISWSRSRLISSAMPLLAFGIGVSATTSWLPTMPMAIDGMLLVQRP